MPFTNKTADKFSAAIAPYAEVFDILPTGIAFLNSDGTVLWANAAWKASAKESAVGQDLYMGLQAEIVGPERPVAIAIATGQTSNATIECPGRVFYRLSVSPNKFADLESAALIATLQNITSQVMHSKTLQGLLDAGVQFDAFLNPEFSALDFEKAYDRIRELIQQAIGDFIGRGSYEIRVIDSSSTRLVTFMSVGVPSEVADRPLVVSEVGSGQLGYVAHSGNCYISNSVGDDPLSVDQGGPARSSLSVPILLHERVIGVLGIGRPEQDAFNESDIDLFGIFALFIASGMAALAEAAGKSTPRKKARPKSSSKQSTATKLSTLEGIFERIRQANSDSVAFRTELRHPRLKIDHQRRDVALDELIAALKLTAAANANELKAALARVSFSPEARQAVMESLGREHTRAQVFGEAEPSVEGFRDFIKRLSGHASDSLVEKQELCKSINFWKDRLDVQLFFEGQPCTVKANSSGGRGGAFQVRAAGKKQTSLRNTATFPALSVRRRR